MATHGWRTGRTLETQLLEEGNGFNYFQLIHLLERIGASQNAQHKESPSSADDQPAKQIDWRIHADLDAAFAATEISDIQVRSAKSGESDRDELVAKTANYCLAGNVGPLPENYTDWIRDQQREGKLALTEFLDIFNHRINVLRYQVKRDGCLALDHRRPDQNLLAPGISAVMGMLGEGLFEQLPLSKRSLMSLSGLLASRRVGARTIQRVIAKCFGIEARVTDVIGVWRDTTPEQHWKLGEEGISNLGKLCILGQKNMDMQGKIRVEIGPVDIKTYMALLPDMRLSRHSLEVAIRSERDLLKLHSADTEKNMKIQVPGNIKLRIAPEMDREDVMVPTYVETILVRNSKQQRATRFSGYLYRPFAAMLRYLTNSQVDIDVVMELDASTLNDSRLRLQTPARPQDAHLRLGQSFWVRNPESERTAAQPLAYEKTRFTIRGFDSDEAVIQ